MTLQCSLYLTAQESVSDEAKITQFISLLVNKALSWATAVWEQNAEPQTSYQCFITLFHHVFDQTSEGKAIGKRLIAVKQGRWHATNCALEFHTQVAESVLNEPALKATYWQGLNPKILTELACRDDEATHNSLIDLYILLDNLLRNQNRYLPILPANTLSEPMEPMQIGCTHLSTTESKRHGRERLCFYCGESGHAIVRCST